MSCEFPGCTFGDDPPPRACRGDDCDAVSHHMCYIRYCALAGIEDPEGTGSYCFNCALKTHGVDAAAVTAASPLLSASSPSVLSDDDADHPLLPPCCMSITTMLPDTSASLPRNLYTSLLSVAGDAPQAAALSASSQVDATALHGEIKVDCNSPLRIGQRVQVDGLPHGEILVVRDSPLSIGQRVQVDGMKGYLYCIDGVGFHVAWDGDSLGDGIKDRKDTWVSRLCGILLKEPNSNTCVIKVLTKRMSHRRTVHNLPTSFFPSFSPQCAPLPPNRPNASCCLHHLLRASGISMLVT